MGKGEDAEEEGMEDGTDNKEKKAFQNSPSYMNRANVRYIVEWMFSWGMKEWILDAL